MGGGGKDKVTLKFAEFFTFIFRCAFIEFVGSGSAFVPYPVPVSNTIHLPKLDAIFVDPHDNEVKTGQRFLISTFDRSLHQTI